jgi:hypothetical protein
MVFASALVTRYRSIAEGGMGLRESFQQQKKAFTDGITRIKLTICKSNACM